LIGSLHVHVGPYLCTAGQADEKIENEQTSDESFAVVLDDWILVTERCDYCFWASELQSPVGAIRSIRPSWV